MSATSVIIRVNPTPAPVEPTINSLRPATIFLYESEYYLVFKKNLHTNRLNDLANHKRNPPIDTVFCVNIVSGEIIFFNGNDTLATHNMRVVDKCDINVTFK